MKTVYIDGSPKPKNSNSGYLLKLVRERLPAEDVFADFRLYKLKGGPRADAVENVLQADTLIFAFPLYVDGVPGFMLDFLEELEREFQARPAKDTRVYVLANCGFFEGHQNHIALEIMRNWTERCGLVWGQGLGAGGGEMLGNTKNVPMGRGPNKRIDRGLKQLLESIKAQASDRENIYVNAGFPRWLFVRCANTFWVWGARKNGVRKKDMYAR